MHIFLPNLPTFEQRKKKTNYQSNPFPIPCTIPFASTSSTSSSHIRANDPKKKKRKKLITYLQTVTRIQNPRSSYFSFHSRICRCTVSYRRSPPPPFQPPSKLLGPNLLRARRRSFCTILSLPFPKISTGTARLNSTGSTRVKRNWPRRRPFRGRETGRFHAGKGYAVGRAPHLDARCVHLNRLLSFSLFFGCTRRRHRYFSRKKGRRWDKGG